MKGNLLFLLLKFTAVYESYLNPIYRFVQHKATTNCIFIYPFNTYFNL